MVDCLGKLLAARLKTIRLTNSAVPTLRTISLNRGGELTFIGPLHYFHGLEQHRLKLATLTIGDTVTALPDVTVPVRDNLSNSRM